jgi:prefoldin subunit 5
MRIGAPSPRHPSILWLVLAVVLMAMDVGISLYDRRRFKKTISVREERVRELEGQSTERDSRIAELESELMSYSHEVRISPY